MAPINTFGSMTMAANVLPKGLRSSNDQGIGFVQFMNSAYTSNPTGGPGQGSTSGTIDSQTAKEYQGIKANMKPEQQGNRSVLGRISDFIVNKKINDAVAS